MGSGPTEKRVGPYRKYRGIIRNEWRIIKGLRADRKKGRPLQEVPGHHQE